MAAQNHVPDARLSTQVAGQNMFNDGSYLPASADAYVLPAWNIDQNNVSHQHSNLVDPALASSTVPNAWQPSIPQQHQYHHAPDQHHFAPRQFSTPQPQSQSPYQHSQYGQFGYQPPASAIDPSFVQSQSQPALRQTYQVSDRNIAQQQQSNTVAPQALQQHAPSPTVPKLPAFSIPKTTAERFASANIPSTQPVQVQRNPSYNLPKSIQSGNFRVIDREALVKATKSKPLTKFVTVGTETLNLPTNRTPLPQYNPRQSLNDLKKHAAGNKKLLAKFQKKSHTLLKPSVPGRLRLGSGNSPSSLNRATESDSETESSEEDSDYSSDEEPVEKSPLDATRPDEPLGAVRYDVIKSIWLPKRTSVPEKKIRESLKQFWEVFKTIQDRWRADSKAVADAEAAKKTSELPLLKSRVKSQRDLLEMGLKTSLEHGHPDILHNLGQVRAFLYLLYLFLANRLKAQDYDGTLTTLIFETLSRCSATLTAEALEATKLDKALKMFQKKVNEKNKAVIAGILEKVAASSKKLKAESPAPNDRSNEAKDSKKRPADSSADAVKKPKMTESPLKRPTSAKPAPTAPALKNATTSATGGSKRPGEKAAPTAVKPRANQVVNKPSSLFASYSAAAKKPTPTPAAKSMTQDKPAVKKAAPAAPVAPRPTTGFANVMSSILNAKTEPVEKPKPEKELPPETPEEKARRLRKESRRHLRVSFKPEPNLVQIKVFHHEPEEESGHDASLVRDAGDIGGEGRMFKQHKDMMDIDDDDEEPEQSFRSWIEPSNIDFSVVPNDERARNYAPYGGGEQKPVCPEKEANEGREKSTLMVFYSHPSDIPSSPREPLEPASQEPTNVTQFGTPPSWVQTRAAALAPQQAPAGNDWQKLESIFAQFSNQNTPAAMSQPPTAPAYQAPYPAAAPQNPAPAAAPAPNLASILSALQQTQQQAQPAAQAPVFQPAQPAPPAPSAQPAQFDLAAILATLQSTAPNSTPATATAAVPTMMPNLAGWPFAQPFTQQPPAPQQAQPNYASQPDPQHNQYANESGKRGRREDSKHEERDHGHSYKKHKPASKIGGGYKVLPCRYYQQGRCLKGDACTYIHDRNDQ
jgi:hypothetical protein